MKKIYIIAVLMLLLLSGCGKKTPMADFIPTIAPSSSEDTTDTSPTVTAATPTPKTIYVGQTTTKYVNLTEYNDVLNVREKPSTDSDIVGFLVHTEKVDVIEVADGWASFVYNGSICYVNADFLVDEKPAYLEPPTITPVPDNKDSSSDTSGRDI